MQGLYVWVLLRFSIGFIFLWAFFDKLFGLGFATSPDKSWLHSVSPTVGFLKFGSTGIFSNIFHGLAGNSLIDWLFMLGLLFVGAALLLGICVRIAGYAGSLMMFLIYLSLFPPKNNPLIDEHIIYILVLIGLTKTDASSTLGLGKWWQKTKLVKKYPFLG